ncbi:MAG: hypothetical protein KF789_06475 [Bdellovibrionaceae bacterium]|nr:hypothetical protein [Pseudobdellovibrionaceae bacterium]
MNKRHTIILPLIGLAFAGCGQYDKAPVADLDQIRANGKTEILKGPEKPREVKVPVIEQRDRIVEKEVIKYEVVEKVVEQAALNEGVFAIVPDSDMNFTEGQEASFKVRVRIFRPEKISYKLVGKNLPAGAVLKDASTEADKDVYALTWKAPYNTVTGSDFEKNIPVKLEIQIASVTNTDGSANDTLKKSLDGLVREKNVSLRVLRDRTPPADVKVEGLATEVQEGSVVPVQVTAKIAGYDQNSRELPVLTYRYDQVAITSGNNFQEMDGTRHIVADTSKKAVEYVGNSVWKFNFLFDTKNIAAQPQLDKAGQVLPTADGTRVRLSFKVQSPSGATSAEILKQVKIRYDRPLNAPRFDLSGLGQDNLEVTAGMNLTLAFYVETGLAKSTIKVTSADVAKLPGKASLACKDSAAKSGSRQICALRWSIPCDTSDAALDRQIEFQAQSTVSGQNSETVKQVLKVVKSKDASTCQPGAVASEKETN